MCYWVRGNKLNVVLNILQTCVKLVFVQVLTAFLSNGTIFWEFHRLWDFQFYQFQVFFLLFNPDVIRFSMGIWLWEFYPENLKNSCTHVSNIAWCRSWEKYFPPAFSQQMRTRLLCNKLQQTVLFYELTVWSGKETLITTIKYCVYTRLVCSSFRTVVGSLVFMPIWVHTNLWLLAVWK